MRRWQKIFAIVLVLTWVVFYIWQKFSDVPQVIIISSKESFPLKRSALPKQNLTPKIIRTKLNAQGREESTLTFQEQKFNKVLALTELEGYFVPPKSLQFQKVWDNQLQQLKTAKFVGNATVNASGSKQGWPENARTQAQNQTVLTQEQYVIKTESGGRVIGQTVTERTTVDNSKRILAEQESRIMPVELPRSIDVFSLGGVYSKPQGLIVRSPENFSNKSVVNYIEGKLNRNIMRSFFLRFRSNLDFYYISLVLQELFGPTALHKTDAGFVMQWSDVRTTINYTVSNNQAILTFLDRE